MKLGQVPDELASLRDCVRAGFLGPMSPPALLAAARGIRAYGPMGGLVGLSAARFPGRNAVLDEQGPVTFAELDAQSNALANSWRTLGLNAGDGVAILARNHRGFLQATFAAAKCGARVVLLNSDFSGPQIREVAGREGVDLLAFDEEYADALEGVAPRHGRWRTDEPVGDDTTAPPAPATRAKIVVLTSGTTGSPKGAPRSEPPGLTPVGAILDKVPFRSGRTVELCAPMFHSLGFAQAMLQIGLGNTLVLRRRFDPLATLRSLDTNAVDAMIVVPVMLQRMLDLGDEARADLDLSRLRIVFVAGSQLGAELATRAAAVLGPVLHNLYGSTEVAYATMATPEDLAAEPACVGRVMRGAVVRLLDADGHEVALGETGRIFVANTMQFDGYTSGETKTVIGGLMSSGDVGHFDAHGRLFVDGRDDEMIVSGGENVFPREIEELLELHPGVVEVAAIGVPDETFGQRLRVFVVRRDSALTEDDVKAHVKENLARYKVPRDVLFLDELPRNPTGKVLKRELAGR
ncbi:acyl-CoA synthetase [Nocardioides sp. WS12]|uniref:acyl-CoA synthetase n=1 Tax=Nocardioides sp. WS12 TaxID=2486272 RepID=UPI0015FD015F|nr:acyl-CoA synthetase [Nocardioides sp. WS12]